MDVTGLVAALMRLDVAVVTSQATGDVSAIETAMRDLFRLVAPPGTAEPASPLDLCVVVAALQGRVPPADATWQGEGKAFSTWCRERFLAAGAGAAYAYPSSKLYEREGFKADLSMPREVLAVEAMFKAVPDLERVAVLRRGAADIVLVTPGFGPPREAVAAVDERMAGWWYKTDYSGDGKLLDAVPKERRE